MSRNKNLRLIAKCITGAAFSFLGKDLAEFVKNPIDTALESFIDEVFLEKNTEDSEIIREWSLQVTKKIFRELDNYIKNRVELTEDQISRALDITREVFSSCFNPQMWIDTALDAELIKRSLKLGLSYIDIGDEEIESFMNLIIESSSDLVVEFIKSMPEFPIMSAEAILNNFHEMDKRIGETERQIAKVFSMLSVSDTSNDDFEYKYRKQIERKINIPDDFGISHLDHYSKNYQIKVAYLSLYMQNHGRFWDKQKLESILNLYKYGKFDELEGHINNIKSESRRVHETLPSLKRVLIRGEAGSGKSTLLKWIAIYCALGRFPVEYDQMQEWASYLPIILRLRDWSESKPAFDLNDLNSYTYLAGKDFPLPKVGWLREQFESGRVILMIDGVDEVPIDRRESVKNRIGDIITEFPDIIVLVTSRTTAVEVAWLEVFGFNDAVLLPMVKPDIIDFIRNWHLAVAEFELPIDIKNNIKDIENTLIYNIENRRELRELAQNPLLCAALCALNFSNPRAGLPKNRLELYHTFTTMFVYKRDQDRNISTSVFEGNQAYNIIKKVAKTMLSYSGSKNPEFVMDIAQFEEKIDAEWARERKNYQIDDASRIVSDLVERSGLLRITSGGSIEFTHRTLAEYLAAQEYVSSGESLLLLEQLGNDLWSETIKFALWYSKNHNSRNHETMLKAICEFTKRFFYDKDSHRFLVSCLEGDITRNREVSDAIDTAYRALIPVGRYSDINNLVRGGPDCLPYLKYNDSWDENAIEWGVRTAFEFSRYEKFHEIKESYKEIVFPLDQSDISEFFRYPTLTEVIDILLENDELDILKSIIHSLEPGMSLYTRFWDKYLDIFLDLIKKCNQIAIYGYIDFDKFKNTNLRNISALGIYHMRDQQDIDGIDVFPALKKLTIQNVGGLIDIKGIGKLASLEYLGLRELDKIVDINCSPKLQNIKSLSMTRLTNLKKIDSFMDFSKLELLRIHSCYSLENFDFIRECVALKYLDIGFLPEAANGILNIVNKDIHGLSLGLHIQKLDSLTMSKFLNLRDLYIYLETGSDFGFIENYTLLESMTLSGSTQDVIDNLNINSDKFKVLRLSDFKDIRNINVTKPGNKLQDLSLDRIEELMSIDFVGQFQDILSMTLSSLPKLKYLPVLKRFPSLSSLYISGLNNIENIEFLSDSTSLEELFIVDCNLIVDLVYVSAVSHLQRIEISNVKGVRNWSKLRDYRVLRHIEFNTDNKSEIDLFLESIKSFTAENLEIIISDIWKRDDCVREFARTSNIPLKFMSEIYD
ncbi:NACHT domain-containing protein [Deinococcus cellulosilyticus]|uniref:NACHT domain-containing protein n=1 Tax=Deinococcus cellulosilyticus (strain DSM 18568 / NBRC 106333 / KACC 11606 / 5516J-15) TaxID=1223518 RepID=A0A511NC50_DEIC1|nr:NACHT domain-containing protein [Deinococcus cellulosilyticus]GEM50146.1 hypothetical protein DC3_57810 [Deinococcus cellulosilyticus NBRC 106333 = KACC 11606]